MPARVPVLLFALATIAPCAASAGPNPGLELVAFPMTRVLWRENTLGARHEVAFGPLEEGRLRWAAHFSAPDGTRLATQSGSLDLTGAVGQCDHPRLAVANYEGTDGWLEFEWKPDNWSTVRLPREPVEDDQLVARFTHDFDPIPQVRLDPERCEQVRRRCNGEKVTVYGSSAVSGASDIFSDYSPGHAAVFTCEGVEEAVQFCLSSGAATLKATEHRRSEEMRCRTLLIASQSDDDAIEARAVSTSGVVWDRAEIEYDGLAIPARVWLLTPLTVLADVPIMMGEAVVVGTISGILAVALIASGH